MMIKVPNCDKPHFVYNKNTKMWHCYVVLFRSTGAALTYCAADTLAACWELFKSESKGKQKHA